MNINSENYLTWLLLYIDNELDPTAKAEVDHFLLFHPEAGTTLRTLTAARLSPPPSCLHPDKSLLYKYPAQEPVINPANQAEYFTLYHDNELPPTARAMVEQYLAADKSHAAEWEEAAGLRLRPDPSITYPYIHALYRRSSSRFLWSRWSVTAAASLLLAVFLLLYYLLPTRQTPTTTTVINTAVPRQARPTTIEVAKTAFANTPPLPLVNAKATPVRNNLPFIHQVVEVEMAAPPIVTETPLSLREAAHIPSTYDPEQKALTSEEATPPSDINASPVLAVSEIQLDNPTTPPVVRMVSTWEEEETNRQPRNPAIKVLYRKFNRLVEKAVKPFGETPQHPVLHIAFMDVGVQ